MTKKTAIPEDDDLWVAFFSFLHVRTWKTFSITSLIFIKTLTMEEESIRELTFFDTLLKRNNGKTSIGI